MARRQAQEARHPRGLSGADQVFHAHTGEVWGLTIKSGVLAVVARG
jgi:hypothetical protein